MNSLSRTASNLRSVGIWRPPLSSQMRSSLFSGFCKTLKFPVASGRYTMRPGLLSSSFFNAFTERFVRLKMAAESVCALRATCVHGVLLSVSLPSETTRRTCLPGWWLRSARVFDMESRSGIDGLQDLPEICFSPPERQESSAWSTASLRTAESAGLK